MDKIEKMFKHKSEKRNKHFLTPLIHIDLYMLFYKLLIIII